MNRERTRGISGVSALVFWGEKLDRFLKTMGLWVRYTRHASYMLVDRAMDDVAVERARGHR